MLEKTNYSNPPILYLIRHATPDWSRKDIPYNIPPGPPLIEKGRKEAELLGAFLKLMGVTHLYSSPMERAWRTAEIASAVAQIKCEQAVELIEGQPDEKEADVTKRIWPFWKKSVREFNQTGPVGLVSHGGPLTCILKQLKMKPDILATWCRSFDGNNPLPPAGVWKISRMNGAKKWDFELVFKPLVEDRMPL